MGMELQSHSQCIENGDVCSYPCESGCKKPGGWRAIKYILANESFEKLASMSLVVNITVYLCTKYNLSGIFLVNVVQIWSGTANVSSIVGAIIADAYLGRYLTLLIGTIFSLLGMGAITLTAGITNLRPPLCQEELQCIQPYPWQLTFLFVALGLIAFGAGGIRPCNIAFGADQFDTNTKKGRAQLECFFDWWYFSFTIVLIIALTGVVYVQTNISWVVGFAIPTSCFVLSIAIFFIGRHSYVYKIPQGTVFVDLVKVICATYKKRMVDFSSRVECIFYESVKLNNEEGNHEKTTSDKSHRLTCFDKAAVITDPGELDAQGKPKTSWRLCSLQQVENLKCLVKIVLVWVSGLMCFVVMDKQSTLGILQAIQMNRGIGRHFTIPPGWMGITSMIALSIWILIYENIYIPGTKIISKKESRLTMQQKISTGIVTSFMCMVVAGLVETKRKEIALRHKSFISSLHVSALLPQFILSGLTEAFAAISIMEFFTLRLPESMRSVGGALFFLSLSIGSYMSSFIVNIIHTVTGGRGKTSWLGDSDLNKSKLELYYYLIAILAAINLIYFSLFAHKYVPFANSTKEAGEHPCQEIGCSSPSR